MLKQILKARFRNYNYHIQTLKNLSFHKIRNNIGVRTLSSIQQRNFSLSETFRDKVFHETENNFIFNIINKSLPVDIVLPRPNPHITNETTFNLFLNQNWRTSNATEIVEAFKSVKQYCVDQNINVSDSRFDGLVDGLMDHCEKLTDNELLELLTCLSYYPRCSSFQAHNFHDIWSCLDDMCLWRLNTWNLDMVFDIADAWFKLNMGKVCDFLFEVLEKLSRKADKLTKDQLVHIFFYFNVCRKRNVDFEYESAIEQKIHEMNVDEMAIVALGFFKTQSKIKILSIQQAMIREVTRKSMGIHEISLTAIMKAIRFSTTGKLMGDINRMLDSLHPELDRLSEICSLHIALLSTGVQTYHKNTLSKCSEKIVQNISNTRLKDIERILNVLTMFNFNPKTKPDIFQAAYEELHKDSRIQEINQFPRCLPCALNYLSLQGIYSYKLMNRILDIDFINLTYGKSAKFLPRELLALDASIDIECPDYKGNRLPLQLKYKSVKWHTQFTPAYHQWKKITAMDQLILDAIDSVKKIVKNEEFVFVHHILPHYPRADIVICKDKNTGEYVKPIGFERYILGDVMVPYTNDSLKWYAIIVLGWNNTIRDTSLPLGHTLTKERQLKKLGYNPVMVIWNQFMKLSPIEKEHYILEKLV